MNKLKERWGVKSNLQLIIIFIVFSITGSLSVWFRNHLFEFLGIGNDFPWYYLVPLYVITIIPIYYLLLLVVGALFGQYPFFLNFEKNSLGRLFRRKSKDI